jgi:hypothetical protein
MAATLNNPFSPSVPVSGPGTTWTSRVRAPAPYRCMGPRALEPKSSRRRRFSLAEFCRTKVFGLHSVGNWRTVARLQIERDRG